MYDADGWDAAGRRSTLTTEDDIARLLEDAANPDWPSAVIMYRCAAVCMYAEDLSEHDEKLCALIESILATRELDSGLSVEVLRLIADAKAGTPEDEIRARTGRLAKTLVEEPCRLDRKERQDRLIILIESILQRQHQREEQFQQSGWPSS